MTQAAVGPTLPLPALTPIAAYECEIAGVKCYMCVLCKVAMRTGIVGGPRFVPWSGQVEDRGVIAEAPGPVLRRGGAAHDPLGEQDRAVGRFT